MNWYAGGLQFECTQCGNCCTGAPGFVWLNQTEQQAAADHLGLDVQAFLLQYTRLVFDGISLRERANGDCVLLTKDKRCAIQAVKPRQCLAFPFWPRLIASRVEWNKAGTRCPGINQGPRYVPEEVDAISEFTTPKDLLNRIFARKRS